MQVILYILYRIGHIFACRLPVNASYRIACRIADIHCRFSTRDRRAVTSNLKVVLGESGDERKLQAMAKEVFRNFAKYLVDFFRFSKIDLDYIKKNVKVEGLDNIDKGLAKGRGAIILSAHIGNWELGGAALSLSGYPLHAVVLTHQNKMINDFFTRQRMLGKVMPIEIGISLRSCYSALRANGLLALLGDRDFSKNGMEMEFFGKSALLPKGPSAFSYRIGSSIIPTFLIREDDDTFRLIIEEPIFPDALADEDEAIKNLTMRYLPVLESYIKKYPTQWYVFREIWSEDAKSLCPDTVI